MYLSAEKYYKSCTKYSIELRKRK